MSTFEIEIHTKGYRRRQSVTADRYDPEGAFVTFFQGKERVLSVRASEVEAIRKVE